MAICYPNVLIYFVLDELDMSEISKDNQIKKYIGDYTCKELRYIFRHWFELKEKIIFFQDKKIVKAPWIEGKYVHVWKDYALKRKNLLSENAAKTQNKSMEDVRLPFYSKSDGEPLQTLLLKTKGNKNDQKQKKPSIDRHRSLTL